MKDFMNEDIETDANSPDKRWLLSAHRPTPSQHHLLPQWPSEQAGRLSITDQELYSRGIIREVMRTRNQYSS
jgi:hypothetical protein